MEPTYIAGRDANQGSRVGKHLTVPQISKCTVSVVTIGLSYATPRYLPKRSENILPPKTKHLTTCTQIFLAAFCIIAKRRKKQLKCP